MGQIKHGAWLSRSMLRCASSFAMAVGLICAFAITGADAQEQPKKKKSSWVKLCEDARVKDGSKKKVCITHHERLDGNTGLVLVSAAIRKIDGQDRERFMVMVPLGMAIPAGIQARVDNETHAMKMNFTICHPGGCTAEIDATPAIMQKLRKGNQLMVAAINALGKPIGFPVPLNGFSSAYDGKPIDSKKYANARRQLMTVIRKRQIERAKKAQQEKKAKQQQNAQ